MQHWCDRLHWWRHTVRAVQQAFRLRDCSPRPFGYAHQNNENEQCILTRLSEEKGKPVKDAFPKVRLVIGDLDSAGLIEAEAAKADVVIRRSTPLPHIPIP
jgi:hypothetical protein